MVNDSLLIQLLAIFISFLVSQFLTFSHSCFSCFLSFILFLSLDKLFTFLHIHYLKSRFLNFLLFLVLIFFYLLLLTFLIIHFLHSFISCILNFSSSKLS